MTSGVDDGDGVTSKAVVEYDVMSETVDNGNVALVVLPGIIALGGAVIVVVMSSNATEEAVKSESKSIVVDAWATVGFLPDKG